MPHLPTRSDMCRHRLQKADRTCPSRWAPGRAAAAPAIGFRAAARAFRRDRGSRAPIGRAMKGHSGRALQHLDDRGHIVDDEDQFIHATVGRDESIPVRWLPYKPAVPQPARRLHSNHEDAPPSNPQKISRKLLQKRRIVRACPALAYHGFPKYTVAHNPHRRLDPRASRCVLLQTGRSQCEM